MKSGWQTGAKKRLLRDGQSTRMEILPRNGMTAVRKSPKDSAHRDRDVTTELAIERRLATPNVEVIAMENENNPHEVLNTHDVARIMKCGVRKVQRLAALGQLPMRLFGAEYVITRKRLQEYLES